MSATDVSSGSHIHTPEWQSFESRMRVRAAERREAKRKRRLRYLGLVLVGCLGMSAGWLGVASWPYVQREAEVRIARWLESEPPGVAATRVLPQPVAATALPVPSSLMPVEETAQDSVVAEPPTSEPDAPAPEPGTTTSAPVTPVTEARTSTRTPVPAAESRAMARSEPVGTSLRNERAEPRLPLNTVVREPAVTPRNVAAGLAPVAPPPAPIEPEVPAVMNRAPGAEVTGVSAPPVVDATRMRLAVRGAIERYRTAYERLDANAARSVWPNVDENALSRAFGSIESQRLTFDDCAIDVDGSTAAATCSGRASIVPKVGGGTQTVRRTWRFALAQDGSAWRIESATVR